MKIPAAPGALRVPFLSLLLASLFWVGAAVSCKGDGADSGDAGGGDAGPPAIFDAVSAPVKVTRDKSGIPHISGKTSADVSYVAGYECARDRLFQMDMLRRTGSGRMAEVYGARYKKPGGSETETYRARDILMRTLGLRYWAAKTAEHLEKSNPGLHRILDAYAKGVSAFIKDAVAGKDGLTLPYGFGKGELDYTPEPWSVTDSLVIGKVQAFGLSDSIVFELLASFGRQLTTDKKRFDDLLRFVPLDPTFIIDGWPGTRSSGLSAGGPPPGPGTKGSLVPPARPSIAAQRPSPQTRPGLPPLKIDARTASAVMKGLARIMRTGPGRGGSNNWVVSGKHTASGKPLLANDPHLAIQNPTSFYMLHLQAEDGLHAAGATFPGVPFILIGHNEKIAWGVTTVRGDVADIYTEQIKGTFVTRDGKKIPVTTRKEVVRIRLEGGSVADAMDQEITIETVPDGVLISNIPDLPLTPTAFGGNRVRARWTGMAITREVEAFYLLNKAGDLAGFKDALTRFDVGAQNLVCITSGGDIGYFARALYPIREKIDPAHPPWFVLPSVGYDFTGKFIPDSSVPQSFNPAKGYIVTANNDPVGNTKDDNPLNDTYYLGPLFANGFRAGQITHLLEQHIKAGTKLEPKHMKEIQLDHHSRIADRLVPKLLAAWDAAKGADLKTSPRLAAFAGKKDLEEAIGVVKAWDREAKVDSAGAAVFHVWVPLVGRRIVRDEVPSLVYDLAVPAHSDVLVRPLVFLLDGRTPPSGNNLIDDRTTVGVVETWQEICLLGLQDAVQHLKRVFPNTALGKLQWGALHRVKPSNEYGRKFTIGPFPRNGGIGTVDVSAFELSGGKDGWIRDDLESYHGPNLRIVSRIGKDGRPSAEFIMPCGQSGVPGSSHFGDMMQDWLQGRYRALPFTEDEVKAAAATTRIVAAGAK